MKLRVLFFLLLCAPLWLYAQPATGVVEVEGGKITGTVSADGAVRVFKGVPFAAPPVGDLRWKAPQPVVPWKGIRACDAFGASPMQSQPVPFSMWSAEFLIPKTPISEDCLYLNVWTPQQKNVKTRMPVIVWIYGGGFVSGGSGAPIYDGEATARKGVVFVSINYRVGAFGFFAHPELTSESGSHASGNYGLMDQIASLRWVRKNISQFGGDPDNVTIAGQSAGSMSVNCLVVSPLAKGLFQKAIAESGAGFTRAYPTLQQAEEGGRKAAEALEATSIAALRSVPAGDVLKKIQAFRGPIIDGYVLPQPVAAIYSAEKQNPVALLTGWNEDEGLSGGKPKNVEEYRAQAEKQFGEHAPEFLRFYPGETDQQAAESQNKLSRDMSFGIQNYSWAQAHSGQGKKTYVYRFTRKLPATGIYAHYGAFHTGEVAYAYDNLRFIDHSLRPLNATDDKLAKIMSSYWVNFAKSGDPNGPGLPVWPAYDAKTPKIMLLGDQSEAAPLLDQPALEFLLKTTSKR